MDKLAATIAASGGHYNLKALIKAIRSCKTLADERAVIQKESAAIRTSFKEEDTFARHNNIAKLLYIHMLGYPAHFGQIECLKLVASPRFADKRLGYLGIMLLLDENQEVLTLVTNSLKNDMNHSNMYAVGLALCTFANISSEEMSRDLANEIEKLLGSSNSYVRKKAALCALRIIRRVPDLMDHFTTKAKALLQDRNHGVLLAGITLVTEMCALDEGVCNEFRQATGLLVKHLKTLVTTGYSPEHDVGGITDPFLQVKILRLLRLLGQGDARASEEMNDILAQVATNTDATKNVGNSILYETVLTVLDIEADSGLRVMAINILGKFLSNRDNNIRYVALNTLMKVVSMDTQAVQRHRNTILDCLRDGDISIRRRALELSYALINDQNIRIMTRELLNFLEVADNEFKQGLTTQISLAAERFAPNKRWQIDTVLRTLKLAGNFVREEILAAFIRLVCHTPELQFYTAHRLYSALSADLSQETLTLAAVWIIGEFADVLLQGGSMEDGEEVKQATDASLVDLLDLVLNSPYTNTLTRQFVLTAAAKLSARLAELNTASASAEQDRIAVMLAGFSGNLELEIQQRAVEFGSLFSRGDVRAGVLERMPPPEIRATIMGGTASERKPVGSTRTDVGSLVDLIGDEAPSAGGPATNGSTSGPSTHDLLADIFGSSSDSTPAASSATGGSSNANADILSLFGSSSSTPATSGPPPRQPAQSSGSNSLFDLGDSSSSAPPAPTPAPAPAPAPTQQRQQLQSYPAYEKHGLKITLTPRTAPGQPGMVQILARFTSSEGAQGVNFQVAVPKTQQLQMQAMSNSDVAQGGTETQQLRIAAPPGAQIRLRMRISFSKNGENITDQADFAGFPADLTAAK
ncbi:adaptin N terminal region-domain-containing protein [Dioszegia hungarica]|uniref:AP-1 complex subunit gamma n=1 Tax=Dioszegia hungarica TaxID=4972 RepID=A0AA38HFA9_9TREE|nr:adaptin N terminal region-domain-containing protein [Dioszegia hungarica]KAI9639440.1 adaptin N terminal region-domain-containing protein [Dioszegia hungarica]